MIIGQRFNAHILKEAYTEQAWALAIKLKGADEKERRLYKETTPPQQDVFSERQALPQTSSTFGGVLDNYLRFLGVFQGREVLPGHKCSTSGVALRPEASGLWLVAVS